MELGLRRRASHTRSSHLILSRNVTISKTLTSPDPFRPRTSRHRKYFRLIPPSSTADIQPRIIFVLDFKLIMLMGRSKILLSSPRRLVRAWMTWHAMHGAVNVRTCADTSLHSFAQSALHPFNRSNIQYSTSPRWSRALTMHCLICSTRPAIM